MLYYRVKPEYDNARLLNRTTRAFDLALVGNELYTEKEWERLVLRYRVSAIVCEPVQISKRNTYFFFGARFADSNETGEESQMKRKGKRNRIDILRASGYAFLRKEGNALYYENRYTGAIVRLQNGRMRCVWR